MHQADIKICVLTGDKLETAESIGFSSKLLTGEMEIIKCRTIEDVVSQFTHEQSRVYELQSMARRTKRAIVIESEALKYILADELYIVKRQFLKIFRSVDTVICCRVSPK